MQKTTQTLIVTGLTSLVIMACGFSGLGSFTRQKSETRPTNATASADPAEAMESQSTAAVEPTAQIEKPSSPAVDPILSAKSCLARRWHITGLSDYVIAAVPPELAKEYALEYVSSR